MKKIALCLLLLSCSPAVFSACAMPTTIETWTLFAEINGTSSIVGTGPLVIAPSGIIDSKKSSMTLIWHLFNYQTFANINTKKIVPLSGKLVIDAKCTVTGTIKTKNPDIFPEIQFSFNGKLDSINKNLVNGIFYQLNNVNIITGKITAMKN
jgi:hypothetical protein